MHGVEHEGGGLQRLSAIGEPAAHALIVGRVGTNGQGCRGPGILSRGLRPPSHAGSMAVIENSKLTVVGAGSVGASTAYAALIRGSARHVALYDIATAKVEAEVLDLAHGTQFTGSSDIIGGSDISVVEGSHVGVITAGAKQNPGQTRIELAAVNARI